MDETVRLTYAELAKVRGITLAAARRLALRHKWRKQLGNDGLTHVWVPISALPRDGMPDGTLDVEPDIERDSTANGHALDEASIALLTKATTGIVSDALSSAMSEVR